MKIYLTFDYELFFGDNSGTAQKCMLEPTNTLFELAATKNVHYTFFVDIGYLIQADKYIELATEAASVKAQILRMIELNHSVQLHIHPHWEVATWKDGKWNMNVNGNYKLSDFSAEERTSIIIRYSKYLEELIGKKVNTFRAGGWCIQPFLSYRKTWRRLEL